MKYVQEGVDELKAMVTENTVKQDTLREKFAEETRKSEVHLQKQITDMKNFCDQKQIREEYVLQGKDKALVYTALTTGAFALVAEIIRIIFVV